MRLTRRARLHIARRARKALRRRTSRGMRAAERRVWQALHAGRLDFDSAAWPSRPFEAVDVWEFW